MTTVAMDPLIQLRFLEEAIVACRGHAGRRVYLKGSKGHQAPRDPNRHCGEGREGVLGVAGVDRTWRIHMGTKRQRYQSI